MTRWVRKAYTVVRRVVDRVPVYGWKVVQTGWRWVTKRIPERVWVRIGWRWVREKVFVGYRRVREKVRVGWTTLQRTRRIRSPRPAHSLAWQS